MSVSTPTLHLMCGKIASGKSTLTRALGDAPRTVVLNEDTLLATLYGGDMSSIADYMRCSDRLRDAMHSHILSLLKNAGLSVVLDFQANTIDSRAWLRSLIDESGVLHVLHYLEAPDAVCKARLQKRNEAGNHAFVVSNAQFDQITSHFVPPTVDEKFNIVVHQIDAAE